MKLPNLFNLISSYLPSVNIEYYEFLNRTLTDGIYTNNFNDMQLIKALVYPTNSQTTLQDGTASRGVSLNIYTKLPISLVNRGLGRDYIIYNNRRYEPVSIQFIEYVNGWCQSNWRLYENDNFGE